MSKTPIHHGSGKAATKAPAPADKATAPATVTGGTSTAASIGTTVVSDVEGAAAFVGGLLGDGKLALLKDVTAAAVKSVVATLDGGVDHLLAAVDKDVAASPVGVQAIAASKTVLSQLGIQLPSDAQIAAGVKAAIADLAAAFLPGTGASA